MKICKRRRCAGVVLKSLKRHVDKGIIIYNGKSKEYNEADEKNWNLWK
ncbi:MAG: hypothetical protein IJO97_06245 [Lachnospiraceae bacterium]|nr:hypothetical protein [Lachnospiraceae bacterium]